MSQTKLSDFMREAFNWTWEEFAKAEKNKQFTTTESIVFAVIRSSAMQNIDSIRIALNRLDGKLKTPVQLEMPRVFYLFPHAQLPEGSPPPEQLPTGVEKPVETKTPPIAGEVLPAKNKTRQMWDELEDLDRKDAEADEKLQQMSLRETLSKMSDFPREVPEAIVNRATEVEQAIRNRTPMPNDIPKVKSVVAAHLLVMAQKRDINALYEAFDQIEGKLTETIQVLGEDIYITSYSSVAPPGAALNADGVLQLEATDTQRVWGEKLKREAK